jgi:predicted negative regulator of RcsB-dependent stress response
VDTQTRHAIKSNALIDSTNSALGWLEEHKSEAITFAVVALAVIALGIGSIWFYQHRQEEAAVAFGNAMDIYSAPVAQPGVPSQPGQRTYPTSAARAEAANAEFVKIASTYGSTSYGKNALYFAGLTDMEMGQTSKAETTLKQAADRGDKNLSALANLALANLYNQDGRSSEAIAILTRLAANPTTTVPAGQAKLQLASIYEKTNPAQAKIIYAELKDKDKLTAAGQIAAAKLQEMH